MLSGRFALDGRPDAAALTGACASSPRAQVVFDGRLDNRRELGALCGVRIPDSDDDTDDAAVVLGVFERFGDDFAARLNGDFAVAVFDAEHESLLLARDVMASRSLYYSDRPHEFLFASRIASILAHPGVTAAPDEDGLAELVLDNWCDDERTCFRGISCVPPGQTVIRRRDRLERRTHWTFDTSRSIRYPRFGDYCEEFQSLFAQAVRRRLRGSARVAVAVSGGLDSSSVFCQAATLSKDGSAAGAVQGISLVFPPDTGAGEAEFLDALEGATDAGILRVPVPSGYRYLDDPDAVVRHLECPAIAPHTQTDLFRAASTAGCSVLLSGFFADQMTADRGYWVDLVRHGRWLKVRHDVREFTAWSSELPPRLLEEDLRRRLIRALPPLWAIRGAKRVIAPWRDGARYPRWFSAGFRARATRRSKCRQAALKRLSSEHVTQYSRHLTAGHYVHAVRCERALGAMYGVDVRYPYRDRDLVSFLMAIPGDVVNAGGVPKGLLRHAMAGLVPEAIRLRRSKADFSAVENQSLRRAYPQLLQLLSSDSRAARAGFIDSQALQRAAPPGDEDEAAPGWRLTDAAGLEFWMRHFLP